MAERDHADLRALDRDVARGAQLLARWRERAARAPGEVDDDSPLEPVRHVAGKTTWDELGELAPVRADEPLRDALRDWVAALLLARIDAPGELAHRRVAEEARGRLDGDAPERVGWTRAWREVVGASTPVLASRWLAAAADCGPSLRDVARARAERRVEAARRLGIGHPWAIATPAPLDRVRAAAERLLAGTDELSRAAWATELRDGHGAAYMIHAATARDAGEGWPARLTPRWVNDAFRAALASAPVHLSSLPRTLGASSYLRALSALGYAYQLATIPSTMPFALGREPGARRAHRVGFVVASLAADPEWQMRILGVGRRTALTQGRTLARSMLLAVRLQASRLLLADDEEPVSRERFEQGTARLFGLPLDDRFRGAWPAGRDDEPARFVAMVEALAFARELRDAFDVDWFRNPRAWDYVRGLSARPAREPVEPDALDAGVVALVRALEAELA